MVASLTLVPQFSNNAWSYQGTTSMNGSKSAILDYTATSQGEYYLRVNGDMYGTQPGYTIISMMLATEISLNAFGNLTYNGFGFNFGAGKIAFISDNTLVTTTLFNILAGKEQPDSGSFKWGDHLGSAIERQVQ